MKTLNLLITFLILTIVFISCDEQDEYDATVSVDKISIADTIRIRTIVFNGGDNGLLCGGNKNTSGSIYSTDDGGHNWIRKYHSDSLSVNSLFYLNDSVVFACGDSLMILKSIDGGQNWDIVNLDNYPFDEYYVPYHEIYANSEENIFAIGGEDYYKGLWSETETGNYPWTHDSYDNELASICFVSEYIGFFGGYGIMFVTEDRGNTFDYIDFEDEFFVDMEADEFGNVYAVSDRGLLYFSSDLGYNWSEEINDYYAEFTDLSLGEETSVVCGWDGIVYIKTKDSEKWTKTEDVPKLNYYCSCVNARNEIFLGSDNGEIYILNKKRVR
jgi:photosystem II stability/assembly factor-like uncharacterized protein